VLDAAEVGHDRRQRGGDDRLVEDGDQHPEHHAHDAGTVWRMGSR